MLMPSENFADAAASPIPHNCAADLSRSNDPDTRFFFAVGRSRNGQCYQRSTRCSSFLSNAVELSRSSQTTGFRKGEPAGHDVHKISRATKLKFWVAHASGVLVIASRDHGLLDWEAQAASMQFAAVCGEP